MPKPLEDDTPPLVLYNRQNVKQIDIISNPKTFSSNRYITEQFHYEPLGHNEMKHDYHNSILFAYFGVVQNIILENIQYVTVT